MGSSKMDTARCRRVVIWVFIIVQILCASHGEEIRAYIIPEITLQAFKPRGFRASIPDSDNPKINLFMFTGNINRPLNAKGAKNLEGQVKFASNDKWVFEDPSVTLKPGDVINYYVNIVTRDLKTYIKWHTTNARSFTIQELVEPEWYETQFLDRLPGPLENNDNNLNNLNTQNNQNNDKKNEEAPPLPLNITPMPTPKPKPQEDCRPTLTKLRRGTACAGQTIFEDHFDSLREDLWQIEHYIPTRHPEHPFVSYQRLLNIDPTVAVVRGMLRIKPYLQETLQGFTNDTITTGRLDLFNGCTKTEEECYVTADGASILPPVASGRLSSRVAFTYGTVTVRARLPQGNWIYPEILLEPFLKKYGRLNYASGVVKIAMARGNTNLYIGDVNYGNKRLEGGPILNLQCRAAMISYRNDQPGQLWGDEFHDYSVRWTPESITLLVDGVQWASLEPSSKGLREKIPSRCRHATYDQLGTGGRMAPFDDHFYLTLGVAAGGVSEFPDELPKPWRNPGRKAVLDFWRDEPNWLPTWNQPEMLVDYVKIVAL